MDSVKQFNAPPFAVRKIAMVQNFASAMPRQSLVNVRPSQSVKKYKPALSAPVSEIVFLT